MSNCNPPAEIAPESVTMPVPGFPPKTATSWLLAALLHGTSANGGTMFGIMGRLSHLTPDVFHTPDPPVVPLSYPPSGSQMSGETPVVAVRVVEPMSGAR